jgi:enoyl-CoA hydratase
VSEQLDFWSERDPNGVLTFTLNRPKKLNAVTGAMVAGLHAAVRALADDDGLRVLVIAAEGRYFTAGADITDLPIGEIRADTRGIELRRNYRRLHEVFDEVEAIEKPVILAAQGPCLGIGVELASSCDFRLASADAIFGLPEVRNIAALPGSGGISRLTRLVGPHWVKWMAMAGQNIDAQQALAAGFVHAVYPPERFRAEVATLARDLAGQPGEAVGLAKLVIDAAAAADRTTARDFDRIANTSLLLGEEHRVRVEKFRTKSPS